MVEPSPYMILERSAWAALRAEAPLTLTEAEIAALRGIHSGLDLREVVEVYLPLSRLLNLYVAASQQLSRASSTFLGHPPARVPFVIGVAGSVAAGKSTTSRILRALLARWPESPRVDLVTTDGFLRPNAELERRGIMDRKGFPESYDVARLLRFVSAIKAGSARVSCPVYSHTTYDIVPGAEQVIERPDIVIIEGLNVLQYPRTSAAGAPSVFVSDYFDFSIYVDAARADLRAWYVDRFLALRDTAFQDPASYFHRYAGLSDEEARALARSIWERINEPNLLRNIEPTRERASLVLRKGSRHVVRQIGLRKV